MPFDFLKRNRPPRGTSAGDARDARSGDPRDPRPGLSRLRVPDADHGYVYLAAARLPLHRSDVDWAPVFEIFGLSPRSGIPDVSVWSSNTHWSNWPDGGSL